MTWRAALLALNAVALLVALGWLYFDRGFEPLITSALCASGLITLFAYQKRLGPLKIELFNGSPCEQTEPAGAVGHAIRFFSVAVTNQGGEHLDECSVQLWHIKAVDGSYLETAYLPIELRTQHQHQSSADGHFNLKARETKYIRVAAMDETRDSSEIVLQYATDNIPNPIRRGDFIVTLRAFGAPSFAEEKFRLFISPDGRLRMRNYTPRPS